MQVILERLGEPAGRIEPGDGRVIRADDGDIPRGEPAASRGAQAWLGLVVTLRVGGEDSGPAGADQHDVAGTRVHALLGGAGSQHVRSDTVLPIQMRYSHMSGHVQQDPSGDHRAHVVDAAASGAVGPDPGGGMTVVELLACLDVAKRIEVRGRAMRGQHEGVVTQAKTRPHRPGAGGVVAAVH